MMQRLFLEYVRRYFGRVIIKAGFSEEEVLGLPLRQSGVRRLSINSMYIWPWGLKHISGSLKAITITHPICVNVNGFSLT